MNIKLKINNRYNLYKTNLKSIFRLGKKPDFLIIGAQKAGTTSLYKYIEKYSENFVPPINKELYFFTRKYNNGFNWYKALFKNKKNMKTGEGTPNYLFYHKAPERIVQHLPKVKLVVLLRNPIDRAYSQYRFQNDTDRLNIYNPLSFEEAIKEDIYRYNNNIYTKNDEFDYIYKYFSYISRGIYYDQLIKWFRFFPRDQILIIKSEDFFKNTENILEKVFEFIGLEFNNKQLNFKQYNKNSYNELDKKIHQYLEEFYKPHNAKLYKLLNKDFEW